jgi:integrase
LTGCRLGELCGLRLSDDQVNLVAGHRVRQLFVERHLTRASTVRPVVGPTKTGATRHVDVGTDLGRLLDRLHAERPKLALRHGWRPVPEWLFVSRVGHPYDQTSIRRDWDRMLKLAGLGDTGLTPHSMRHSFATWHIARGRHAKWVSQQLGHAKISITLNLYAKWFAQVDTQAADALGSALLGNGLGNGTGS